MEEILGTFDDMKVTFNKNDLTLTIQKDLQTITLSPEDIGSLMLFLQVKLESQFIKRMVEIFKALDQKELKNGNRACKPRATVS